uniref:DNA repair protein SWI5 homolog n=1 Tax=Arion vulgaris TaxID=1028688 RepID=A0A0B7BVW2_9EUPU
MNKSNKSGVTGKIKFISPLSKQFQSPLSRSNVDSPKESHAELTEKVVVLKKRLQDTNSEIQKLEAAGYRESELQTHIEKLHEYNEIKDVGQMLLGRIAVIEGIQSKDLYEKYGLNLND